MRCFDLKGSDRCADQAARAPWFDGLFVGLVVGVGRVLRGIVAERELTVLGIADPLQPIHRGEGSFNEIVKPGATPFSFSVV